MISPYNLTNDFLFRSVFGKQKNAHILRSLINAVLEAKATTFHGPCSTSPDTHEFHNQFLFRTGSTPDIILSRDISLHYIELPKLDFCSSSLTTLEKWVYLRRRIAMIKRIRSEVPEMDKAAKEYAKLVANAKVMAAELQREKMVARRIEQPGCRPRRRAG